MREYQKQVKGADDLLKELEGRSAAFNRNPNASKKIKELVPSTPPAKKPSSTAKAAPSKLLNDATTKLAEANLTKSGNAVLGPYIPEKVRYINKAIDKVASYFDLGKAWDRLTDAERWAANQHFLDKIAAAKDQVFLSIPKGDIRPDSYLAKEVKYLTEVLGYKWVNQWSLVPGG